MTKTRLYKPPDFRKDVLINASTKMIEASRHESAMMRRGKRMAAHSREIAKLRASGCSNCQIAAKLNLSKKTIEQYVWKFAITPDGRIQYPNGDSPPRPRWVSKGETF